MPSTKDPVSTVQPGPGHLPEGTVSASSLDFNPGLGPLAALQAHITNPTGAHAASAISTTVLTGETWSNPASSNVQAALARAFEGINARPIWVLDSNPANKADFVGAAAFSNAVAAIGTHRPILFLRAGTYTWNDPSPTALDHVTVIGVDQNTVTINSSGALRFGDHTDITNATLSGTSVNFVSDLAHLEHVQLSFTSGLTFTGTGNTLIDVALDANSSAMVMGDGNLLTGVSFLTTISTLGVGGGNLVKASQFDVDNAFTISGDSNTFEETSFLGGASSSVVGQSNAFLNCALQCPGDLIIGGLYNRYGTCDLKTTSSGNIVIQDLGGADGAHFFDKLGLDPSGEVRVSTSGCTFLRADFSPTASGSLYIRDIGTNNTYVNVRCSQMSCEGSNGSLSGIEFLSGLKVPGNPTLAVDGDNYSVDGVQFSPFSSISQAQLSVNGNKNTIKRVDLNSSKSTTQDLLEVFGDGCSVEGVSITSGAQAHVTHAFVRVSGIGSTVDTVHISGTSFNTGLLSANGIRNTIRNVTLTSLTNLSRPMIDLGGTGCVVEQVYGTGLGLSVGGTFQLVKLASGLNCTARDIEVTASPNFGTTSDLIQVNGCTGCVVSSVYLDGLGATDNVGSAVFRAVTAMSFNTIVRNVVVRNSVFASSNGGYIVGLIPMFEINFQFLTDTTIESCDVDATVTYNGSGGDSILVYNGSSSTAIQNYLRIKGCNLITTGRFNFFLSAWSGHLHAENCYFKSTVNLSLSENSGSESPVFIDCVFESSGNSGTAGVVAGVFTNCTFIGTDTGSANQLFYGFGPSSSTGERRLVLQDCTMMVGLGNVKTNAISTMPIVILGGNGNAAGSNHGGMRVDGLLIRVKPNSLIVNWHTGPTLAIDTANQAAGQHSSFSNITIDLSTFTDWIFGGASSSVFNNIDTNVGVLEIQGPATGTPVGGASAERCHFRNISIVNISRTGFGSRHIVKAQGAIIDGLIVDTTQSTGGSSFSTDIITIANTELTRLDMYPTHSLPTSTGGTAMVKIDKGSVLDRAYIRNLRSGTIESGYIVNVDSSTMSNCVIEAQSGSGWQLEAIVVSSTTKPSTVIRNRVTQATQASSAGATPPEALRCFGDACKILFNEFYNIAVPTSGSAPNAGGGISFAVQGNNNLIEGNTLRINWYTDNNSTTFFTATGGAAFTDFVNNTMINDADPVATGFGTAGGSMIATFLNTYGSIVNNTLVGRNTANRISINAASGGTRRILSNHVENKDTGAGTGTILTAGGDIPTPVGSYNITT